MALETRPSARNDSTARAVSRGRPSGRRRRPVGVTPATAAASRHRAPQSPRQAMRMRRVMMRERPP
eukprot:9312479-Alexandrium_andersonii.AAC.1